MITSNPENHALIVLNSLTLTLARRQDAPSRAILTVLADLKERATPELPLSEIRHTISDLEDQITVIWDALDNHEREQKRLRREPR